MTCVRMKRIFLPLLTLSSSSIHAVWTTILQAAHFLRGADFLKRTEQHKTHNSLS